MKSSPLRFYGLEQERVNLSQLKKNLEYWLGSLQDFLTWHFPLRLLRLRDSEQRLHEFNLKYTGKARFYLKHSQPKDDLNMQIPIEKLVMRVAKLVKELRDLWSFQHHSKDFRVQFDRF